MGCDWYDVYYCEGEGHLINYEGTVTGFMTMCYMNGIFDFNNYYILGYKNGEDNYDKLTLFYGNLESQMFINMPGPYTIFNNYLDYKIIGELENNFIIPESIISNIDIKTGKMKILTTCFEKELKPNLYDFGPTEKEIQKIQLKKSS